MERKLYKCNIDYKKPKENENQDGWVWLVEERTGGQDDEIIKITLSVQHNIFWGHK